ncbi:MAG TPA: DUF1080 domain-containing protein, partial [Saprospiraceae bacterium]|nr:DUF1080 domain-containing protein [Saprospiraceae bacterium]
CIRLDDLRPHILRTHDGGKTWQEITRGLPAHEPVNTVREDPQRPGMLYAGTENAVYISFDDGENWHSLRLNMPATSIRDLVVKDDDLVVGTHGRSFWILDNISPLRQLEAPLTPDLKTTLFQPQTAYRLRWNLNTDTPVPQEEPAGPNPPEGAAIDFVLDHDARSVSISIFKKGGGVVRTYTRHDPAPDVSAVNIPLYWIKPPQSLPTTKGAHRFYWDLRYDDFRKEFQRDFGASFPMSAIYGQTAPEALALWVMPGQYVVELNVDGQIFWQNLEVRMDPRITTSREDLQQQFDISALAGGYVYSAMRYELGFEGAKSLIDEAKTQASGTTLDTLRQTENALNTLNARAQRLHQQALSVFAAAQETDMPPTSQMSRDLDALKKSFSALLIDFAQFEKNYSSYLSSLPRSEDSDEYRFASRYRHPEPEAAGFVNLFDAGLSNAIYPKGKWQINAAGELTASEDQCIFSRKTYRNFVLDLEFKTAEGTNSGVIVHCSDPANWIPNSVEIQIADDYSEEWSKADPSWQCGAIFGHLPASQQTVKQPGEWNRLTITCIDRQIWVLMNGEQVNHMDMNRWLSGSQNPDGSPIPSWLPKPFATLPLEGHIGLQGKHAGAPVWFRNVRIRELR